MVVYVLNKHGKALMPCHPARARILLRQRKAKVVQKTPFTIQLLYGSSGYKQPVALGVKSGYQYIRLSAVTSKREIYAAEIELRKDISKLLTERSQYRRNRRYRKSRYRKPRFLNRKKPEGWLPPSIQHKLDSHIKAVEQVNKILPVTHVNIQVAAFDIQKIKNPDISGEEYQNGEQRGFWNTREYVLYRDNHTCQICKGKSGDTVLKVHHILPRSKGGTDRPENLITLCRCCHEKLHKGEIRAILKPKNKGFKAETFISTIRWKVIDKLKEKGYKVSHTYGYLTKSKRLDLGLPKNHINDAFIIAGGDYQQRSKIYYLIQQVRKCNRKLFKGIRSHIRNTAERYIKGFQRYDKVSWRGVECFVFGRRKTGYFELRKLDGTRVHASARASELRLLERAKTFLVERREKRLLPSLTEGVSAARV